MTSDRELLVAVFNVLGALAERVTGSTFMVCVTDADGNVVHLRPDTTVVTWAIPLVEESPQNDVTQESLDMLCAIHPTRDATQPISRQSVVQ